MLINISRGLLKFTWTLVSHNCSNIYYNIIAAHCGDGPETTTSSSVTCTNVSTTGLPIILCTFAVQTVVCNNILGKSSEPIAVPLRGNKHYSIMIISAGVF